MGRRSEFEGLFLATALLGHCRLDHAAHLAQTAKPIEPTHSLAVFNGMGDTHDPATGRNVWATSWQ